MILYFLALALIQLLVVVFSLLPDSATTFPLPPQVTFAFQYFGELMHWSLYLFGTEIGDTLVHGMKITLFISIPMMIWRILVNFRAPVVSRFISRDNQKV